MAAPKHPNPHHQNSVKITHFPSPAVAPAKTLLPPVPLELQNLFSSLRLTKPQRRKLTDYYRRLFYFVPIPKAIEMTMEQANAVSRETKNFKLNNKVI